MLIFKPKILLFQNKKIIKSFVTLKINLKSFQIVLRYDRYNDEIYHNIYQFKGMYTSQLILSKNNI